MLQKKFNQFKIFIIILYFVFLVILNPISVQAQSVDDSVYFNNFTSGQRVSGDIVLTGWVSNTYNTSNIDFNIDNQYIISKEDIKPNIDKNIVGKIKYLTTDSNGRVGFEIYINTRGLSNNNHTLFIKNTTNNSIIKSIVFRSENTYTPIMGSSTLSRAKMVKYLYDNNKGKDLEYIENFVSITIEEAQIEGIRPDVVFVQMMKETNFLKFTGTVKEEQNNFAGIGATGPGIQGEYFPNIRTGIRAVVQHLKAYASTEALKQDCVDPRYKYVKKGVAPYVEWLGINENPNSVGWATDRNYGYDIVNRITNLQNMIIQNSFAKINNINVQSNNLVNHTLQIQASAFSENLTLYTYWVKEPNGIWRKLVNNSESNSISYTPNLSGTYRFVVDVKDISSANSIDDYKYVDVVISKPTFTSFNVSDINYAGEEVKIEANATSVNDVSYRFWLKNVLTNEWTLLSDYSKNNVIRWRFNSAGKYRIVVHIKDSKSLLSEDNYVYKDITIYEKPAKINKLEAPNIVYKDQEQIFTTAVFGTDRTLYKYYIKDYKTNTWKVLQDFGTNNTLKWTPRSDGKYRIVVHVKEQFSKEDIDDYSYVDIDVKKPKITTLYSQDTQYVEYNNVFLSEVSGVGTILYKYWLKDYESNTWTVLQDYSTNKNLTWKTDKAGKYRLVLHVKNSNSLDELDDYNYLDFEVKKPKVNKIDIDGIKVINNPIQISTSASAKGTILYRYWVKNYKTNQWQLIQDYSENNKINWQSSEIGKYRIVVHIKDSISSKDENDYSYIDLDIVEPVAKLNSFSINSKIIVINNTYTLNATAISPSGALYKFWVCDRSTGEWVVLKDFSESNTVNWKPTKNAKYTLVVHVKDKLSVNEIDDYSAINIDLRTIKDKVIVLDAGHGGDEPGAISYDKLYKEKDLNINLVKILGEKLEQLGATVIYTRQPGVDTKVELQQRVNIANSSNADLFISIHRDSAGTNTSASGATVYYSSYRPYASKQVLIGNKVYDFIDENGTVVRYWDGGVVKSVDLKNVTIYDPNPPIESIKSKNIAQEVMAALADIGFNNRGVRDNNFYVTRLTQMPSILIEAGFMSSPSDMNFITKTSTDEAIANKLVEIIKKLFN